MIVIIGDRESLQRDVLRVCEHVARNPVRLDYIDARPDHVRASDERATEQTWTDQADSKRRGN